MASFDRDVINVEELRDFAAATARAAAARIRTQRAALIDADGLAAHTQTKSSAVDPVTEVDQATERFITEQIVFARPGDGILGEEGADVLSSTGITWIVDPIDGTVSRHQRSARRPLLGGPGLRRLARNVRWHSTKASLPHRN